MHRTSDNGRDIRGTVPRVRSCLAERLPPPSQLALMTTMFVAATSMSGLLLAPRIGGTLGDIHPWRTIAGFAGALLFIVRLRCDDDVRIADTDRVETPTRPSSRGLVAALVLVVEGVLLWSVGSFAFAAWLVAAGWSVLTRMEFFASGWLGRHVATFAISHMIVMGLMFGELLAIGIDARGGEATLGELYRDPAAIGAMLAATSIGIGLEWGRRFERYHAAHGERAWTWWMLWPSLGAIGFTFLARHEYSIWAVCALVAATMATIAAHALVMGQRDRAGAPPTGPLRTAVESAPGVAGLSVYFVLAVAGVVELIA